MNILFGNYGNNSIALIQWAHEQALHPVCVVHVETGWSKSGWGARVKAGQELALRYGFEVVSLIPKNNFAELVKDRKRFPSSRFQWCAGFIKGLPLQRWLSEIDINDQAMIFLPSRKADSRARVNLANMIENNEYFDGRTVCYPLCECSDLERDAMVERTGLPQLAHRSLECYPCIHSSHAELANLDLDAIRRVSCLENEVQQFMFADSGIEDIVNMAKKTDIKSQAALEQFDMGCGAPYSCGE